MVFKAMRLLSIMLVIISCTGTIAAKRDISFRDDFENGTAKWDLVNPARIQIVESGDPQHGKVLSLHPGGPAVYALIKGSAGWTNIKVEGDVYFPLNFSHYMGLIYNFNIREHRADFGCIFIFGRKGDYSQRKSGNPEALKQTSPPETETVLLVNPHRDSNASRFLYPEYVVVLEGDSGVKSREWHHFKAEVAGPVCHFYLDDMKTPKITSNLHEYSSGRIGFKPRYGGSQCRIDNITVTSIKKLSYKGPILPAGINYKPGKLITNWHVIGPFVDRMKEMETDGYLPGKSYHVEGSKYKWKPFETDPRGCVVSGRVCDKFSLKNYAYFHTEIFSRAKGTVSLEFSSTNKLVIWMNGSPVGNVNPISRAWYDFWENPEHKGEKINAGLNHGNNHLIVLVAGGRYAGDGFFAAKKK